MWCLNHWTAREVGFYFSGLLVIACCNPLGCASPRILPQISLKSISVQSVFLSKGVTLRESSDHKFIFFIWMTICSSNSFYSCLWGVKTLKSNLKSSIKANIWTCIGMYVFICICINIFSYIGGFPGGLDGKEPSWNVGDPGLIPGESPWRRKWQSTQVFLLENSMDRGAWGATVYGVAAGHDWATNTFFSLKKKKSFSYIKSNSRELSLSFYNWNLGLQ